MKILYLNQIETNAGWGAECFLRDALEAEGVDTTCVDYLAHEFELAPAIGKIGGPFDAVLVQRGCGYVFPAEILRAMRVPKVLFFTELVARNRDQYSLIGSGCFDHIFVRTPACGEFMISKGWIAKDRCDVSLSACPGLYLDEAARATEESKDIDVLWVGTVLPRRRAILDQINASVAVTEASGYGAEMAGLVRRAKIVLNIHAEDWLDTETRIYEVLGCGGFVVTEKLSGENPFRSGEHLIEAEGVGEMIERIEEYLGKPEERARIAVAGRDEVKRHHTYTARAKDIVSVLSRVANDFDAGSSPLIDEALLEKAAARERQLGRQARVSARLRSLARKALRR